MPGQNQRQGNRPHAGRQGGHQGNNRNVQHREEPAMTAIDAPYNFVPLSDKIVTPDWHDQVSHDLPFEDGLSGEILYTLSAHSPLLVGGEQTKSQDGSTTVKFFKTPDGYAIPGSSLKGMIRAVLEIATFSRMGMVDDKRYGLRDISGKFVAEAYTNRVRDRVKFGFVRLSAGGEPEIVPCDMAQFSHRDLETWWGKNAPIFKKGVSENNKFKPMTVSRKYQLWQTLCAEKGIDPLQPKVQIEGGIVTAIGAIGTVGFPVLTGQISDCSDDEFKNGKWTRGKYHDFIFHSPRDSEAFLVHEADPAAWRDFLFIHGDEDGKNGMPWPDFWKARFWNKEKVPVFYIRNGNRLQMGLAYMLKLAGDFSIHDMIRHTSEDHIPEPGRTDEIALPDFATLIFGNTGDKPEHALKGRVQFEPASIVGVATPEAQPAAILSSPKPTYFPNYIRQKADAPNWKLGGGDKAQYATYLETPQHPKPELRGWKRYPVRPDNEVKIQVPLGEEQERNKNIQLHLHPLPARTSFTGRLVYHNLKPEELGALLWCLDFGGQPCCRHGLGMGKSFGFGQVGFTIDEKKSCIEPNDPAVGQITFTHCVDRFAQYMDKMLKQPWLDSLQIRALLAMADPAHRTDFTAQLKHMVLARVPDPTPDKPNKKKTINHFQDAKQVALVLASYAPLAASGRTPSIAIQKSQWLATKLAYNKGKQEISASSPQGEKAFVSVAEAKPLLDTLDEATRKRLENGKLIADLTLEHCGGKNWKIVEIEPTREN